MDKHDLSELKRILLRLSLLDGAPLACLEGLHLVQVRHVARPAALVDAVCEEGGVSISALTRCCDFARPPARVEIRWLAAAQRDLRVLERNPDLRALVAESRALRRYGAVDAGSLARRQSQIDALSAELHSGRDPAGPLELVETFQGAEARQALATWRARSMAWGQMRRRMARKRVDALAARVLDRRAPESDLPDDVLDAYVARLKPRAPRFAGRARSSVIHEVLAEAVAWPGAAPHAPEELGELPADLADAVEAAGAWQIARIASTRYPEYLKRLDRALCLLALHFRPESSGVLMPDDVHLVLRELSSSRAEAKGAALSMAQGLRLLRLKLSPHDRDIAEEHLEKGLEIELLEELVAANRLEGIRQLEEVAALRAWGRWVLDLAPRLKARGVELKLPPSAFRAEAAGRDRELALFARVVLEVPTDSAGSPASRLARLDTVLTLVNRVPGQARMLGAQLMGTDPGAGRRFFPELAAWLDDDPLLDRYCHLIRLAGANPALPRALMRDFAQRAKLLGQQGHLAGLSAPTAGQRERLARIDQLLATEDLPGRDWTRRHLLERLERLQGRALEVLLDAALREALREGFGINLPALTPAWRDAVRFYLTTERNRELLGRLLQHASARPGEPIVRSLPANQAWIAQAAARFNVEAWLAQRRVEVVAGGRTLRLATEDDPLEVLRMGIPFDTCLSLQGGYNAASTVLNALDANKRVLYLRDEGGTILGRKLIAVSKSNHLLGYQLYLAIDPTLRPELERAVNTFCRTIAEEAGLRIAITGAPAVIHGGFWYDDGPVPFLDSVNRFPDAVERFCEALGRPPARCEALKDEARLWCARQSGDPQAVLDELTGFNRWDVGALEPDLGRWLVDALGQAEALRRGGDRLSVVTAVLDRAFQKSPAKMLAVLAKLQGLHWQTWEHAWELLKSTSDAVALVRALAETAREQCGRTPFNDHSIEHGTLWALPGLVSRVPVAETLDAVDILAPVWAYVAQEAPECTECVTEAVTSISTACEVAYGHGPDPKAVITCLGDSRRSEPAQRVALHLAARFPFPRTSRDPIGLPVGLRSFEGAPAGCPSALQALKKLQEHRPALARCVDFAPAVLRQSSPGAKLPNMPQPDLPPYKALGDLAMHVPDAVAALLAPWDGQLSERPGEWELYHHRRHSTGAKRRLERRGTRDRESAVRLALLGVAALERGEAARHSQRHGAGSSIPAAMVRAAVVAQIAGEEVDARRLPAEAIDPSLSRRRLAAVEGAAGKDLVSAVSALAELPLPTAQWRAITLQLLERGACGAALAAAARAWLPRCTWGLPELPPELALRLGTFPETALLVAETLGRLEPDQWPAWHARLRGLAPQFPGAEQFLERLYATWLERCLDSPTALPPDLVDDLCRAALAAGPEKAVRFYESAGGFARASRLLDRILACFSRDALARCTKWSPDADAPLEIRRAWLRAAIATSAPVPPAPRSRRSKSSDE